jgi:hypothetical protein
MTLNVVLWGFLAGSLAANILEKDWVAAVIDFGLAYWISTNIQNRLEAWNQEDGKHIV